MNEENFNWKKFVRSVYLPVSPTEAYKLAATPEGITKWFIGKALYTSPGGLVRKYNEPAKTGDTYEWDWGYKDFKVTGKVLDTEENKNFAVTFGKSYRVEIIIEDAGANRTLFKLVQEQMEGEEQDVFNYINCYGCWTFFLNNLRSVTEGGIDLREREFNLDELVNR